MHQNNDLKTQSAFKWEAKGSLKFDFDETWPEDFSIVEELTP